MLPSQAYRLPSQASILILRAVLAAGRRRPDSAREQPQALRARALRGSASVPARESLARVRPVGASSLEAEAASGPESG